MKEMLPVPFLSSEPGGSVFAKLLDPEKRGVIPSLQKEEYLRFCSKELSKIFHSQK